METKNIFERVARQYGTTPVEVYSEIQKAIDVGFSNPDPMVQAEWKKMNFKGDKPTPEEVIAYLVGKLQTEKGH